MELNKQDEKLLQELLKKYKQGIISGLYQGTNITFTPTGCRDKVISSSGGSGGDSQTFEQTLDVGNTLSKDDTINCDGNEFSIINEGFQLLNTRNFAGFGLPFVGNFYHDTTESVFWTMGLDGIDGTHVTASVYDLGNGKLSGFAGNRDAVFIHTNFLSNVDPSDETKIMVNDSGNTIQSQAASSYNTKWLHFNSTLADLMTLNTNGVLSGGSDYSSLIQDLDYTQMIYVGFRGTATLLSGTVTVSTGKIKTGYKIYVSVNTPSGTQGFLSAPTASIVDGTSFVINSTSAGDNSTVNWWIAP